MSEQHSAENGAPFVVNPEAIGDPNQTPVLQHSVAGCPAHCEDWLYAAVRNNRRLSGLPPQDCTCPASPGVHDCGHVERQPGCGGCDPGATEFVREDGGPWRRVLPPADTPGGAA